MIANLEKRGLFQGRCNKRPILLLEVLIAFSLIVLVAIPLIYPHSFILRMQREFIKEIELDHYVNVHFAELTERLYKNEIPWDIISGKSKIPLNPKLPYTGQIEFEELKHKPKDPTDYGVYLYQVTYSLYPTGAEKPLEYVYHVMIIHDLPEQAQDDEGKENE